MTVNNTPFKLNFMKEVKPEDEQHSILFKMGDKTFGIRQD